MRILSLESSAPMSLPQGAAVSLGFFDGVHRGHREILACAAEIAGEAGVPCAVWSVADPSRRYKGGAPLLTTEEDKLSLLREAGAAYAVLSDFDSVRSMTGEEFVRDFLCGTLGVSAVVCGFNFRFGKGAAWDAEELCWLCRLHGISCTALSAVTDGGEAVSSSRIRNAISHGSVEEAASLLGRPYSVRLPVLEGKQLGRTLGFPTVNQVIPDELVSPAVGVYAAEVVLPDGSRYPGAANIGHCPTVDCGSIPTDRGSGVASASHAVCETYIVGFDGDLYGQTVEIRFLRRIRGEVKFQSLTDLQRQIKADAEAAVR